MVFCIVFLGTSSTTAYDPYLDKVPYGPKLEDSVHHVVEGAQHVVDHIPNIPIIGTPAHKPPPEQVNSSSGDTRWYSDWKWKNPFSSSVVLDEDRAVLPPLLDRPPIYTYYDKGERRKDEKSRKAEQQLLQIWRRAWWSQGFRPVVLSKSEAMNNPLYRNVQGLKLTSAFEHELLRWLAWDNMGGGILCNFMAVPMAAFDDPVLSFLRRGEYPELTKYKGFGNGVFVGARHQVNSAVKAFVASPEIKTVKYPEDTLPEGTIRTETENDGIAFYSNANLKARYEAVKEKLDDPATVGDALAMLPALINSHLHLTWQNVYSKGIAVLKPLPEHTTALIGPAIDLARDLSQCPMSPIQSSCPPNRPRCKPCVSNSVAITVPRSFRNDSDIFTIGTVPHPLTVQGLIKKRVDLDLRTIRRETKRDVWTHAATKDLLGNGLSSLDRLPAFKEIVASDYGSHRSLWMSAEQPLEKDNEKDQEDLDWLFGFQLPRNALPDGKSETPVPGPERRPAAPKPEYGDGPIPSDPELEQERSLFEKAKLALRHGEKGGLEDAAKTREIIEAWNLADAEIWKFQRAFNARRRLERRTWEEQEKSFQGKGIFDRWMDKVT